MSEYLTIDVGGTNIKYAIMDENANIAEKGDYPTPMQAGLEGFVESIKTVYDRYADRIEAVVMSAPGKIDASKAYFYTSGALGYISGVNLGDVLKEFIKVPFAVENDAKAAALAELWKGSMKDVQNGVVMTLGTGIGGAIIIDGKLYRGSTFAAGELSGIPVRIDTKKPYDLRGMWATPNSVNYLVKDYATRTNQDPATCNGKILFEAANRGDQQALEAIDDFCMTLAAGIMSFQFILDVQQVSIGGGISKQPILMDTLNRKMHEYFEVALAKGLPASIPTVRACEFGNDANMIGALYHYLFELKK